MTVKKIFELKASELRTNCDPKTLGFKTTDEIQIDEVLIEQNRAVKAIDLGLSINSLGFNLYVSGYPGTGRNTTILNEIRQIASKKRSPEDICYIYNFEKQDEPKVLKLPARVGYEFQKSMHEFIFELETEIHKAFNSKEYESKKNEVIGHINQIKENLSSQLEQEARKKGFTIQQSLTGLIVLPVTKEGKPMSDKDLELMPLSKKKTLERHQKGIYDKLYEFSREIRDIQQKIKKEITELDQSIALYTIGHLIDDRKKQFKNFPRVTAHLDNILKDILLNIDHFKKTEKTEVSGMIPQEDTKEKLLNKYTVNLLVNNAETKGAPVVIEDNPSYINLIGQVEQKVQYGILVTDFNMIKSGSIHKANGGYLVIQAEDILKNYHAWDALKRILKYKKLKIESLYEKFGINVSSSLKPEPVNIDVKVVIVGSPRIYQLLYMYDPDFSKLFKVKAEFNSELPRKSFIKKYSRFIICKIKKEGLLPFNAKAVAKIIDYAARISAHKQKLTAQFIKITDLICEADYWSRRSNSKIVSDKYVVEAMDNMLYRSSMIEEKINELINEGTLLVDVHGKEVGQINALSILNMGDYMFGKPSRITARTYIGKGQVINIERESQLSGKIHSKGVLILSSYIGDVFGQDKPLAFSASICFEQLYNGVDGDSASSTELYCILSSLSGLPLRQDIAVTGSINQKGEIQAIGGVNQKIEGFYSVCKLKKPSPSQGVIIPHSNVKNLMLNDEVTEAVKKGKFHIYPIKNVKQGIEILTGVPAGRRLKNGKFTKGSVFDLANEKLISYFKVLDKSSQKK